MNKKLIEVALPLDDINVACEREKSIRHGHPSTLHLWWARRPLASARAVTFASLVDDPSSHPEEFPTEAAQARERERLFNIIRDLVVWENSNNEDVLARAKAEIMKSTGNNPPAFLDPFAGGGALPLEAQRLGLKTYATDLNPIPVMINKAMIEFPAKYANCHPINPDSYKEINNIYTGTNGMISDVLYYGQWMKSEAYKVLGKYYPRIKFYQDGKMREGQVLAWIWARTVLCPNPACKAEVPLIHSFDLSKKKGKEKHLELLINKNSFPYKIDYVIRDGLSKQEGTINRKGAICPCCGEPIDYSYIRDYSKQNGLKDVLTCIVVEGINKRIYLSQQDVSNDYLKSISVDKPKDIPEGKLSYYPRNINTNEYGIDTFEKLFTNRQLKTLTTFSSLVNKAHEKINEDYWRNNCNSKLDVTSYSIAICTYLAFLVDKLADLGNALNRWEPNAECPRQLFARQAIPMVWDHAEANPFSSSSGSWNILINNFSKSFEKCFTSSNLIEGKVAQWDATQDNGLRNIMISTDPPYYDNIPYAYLSDFFYVWLRKSLHSFYPNLFTTILTPKENELTAIRYRFDGGRAEAKSFFENGMLQTCKNLYLYSREDIPVTIYYAFKQSETEIDGTVSNGWETMISAILQAGFTITGTWPMRTEMISRAVAQNSNALASSIVIVCRKTNKKNKAITMRQFLDALKSEIVPALAKLQQASIAPVDLAQSAIGPGIAVYSRYESVIKSDGSKLSVREALKLINHELDSHLTASIGAIDSETSYCLSLYAQKAFNEIGYGDAETLAKAKNVSVADLAGLGVLDSARGKVSLRVREDLPEFKNNREEACLWLVTQQVVNSYRTKGYEGVAEIFNKLSEGTIEKIKSLCYQLFNIADNNGWAQEALAYNEMITTWDSTISVARELKTKKKEVQLELF